MNLLDSKFEFQTLNQALKADFSPAGFLLGGDRKDQRDFLLRFASLEIMDQTFWFISFDSKLEFKAGVIGTKTATENSIFWIRADVLGFRLAIWNSKLSGFFDSAKRSNPKVWPRVFWLQTNLELVTVSFEQFGQFFGSKTDLDSRSLRCLANVLGRFFAAERHLIAVGKWLRYLRECAGKMVLYHGIHILGDTNRVTRWSGTGT